MQQKTNEEKGNVTVLESPIEKIPIPAQVIACNGITSKHFILKELGKACFIKREPDLLDVKFYDRNILLLYGGKERMNGGDEKDCNHHHFQSRIVWWDIYSDCLIEIFYFDKIFDTLSVHKGYVWLSERENFWLWKPKRGIIFKVTRDDEVNGRVERTVADHERGLLWYVIKCYNTGKRKLELINAYGDRRCCTFHEMLPPMKEYVMSVESPRHLRFVSGEVKDKIEAYGSYRVDNEFCQPSIDDYY